jgi:diguanylate cyclase (GGDEF)-like protein
MLATSAVANSLVLLLIDLDDFKNVNDLHGHATGDQLLRQVADQLRSTAPEGAVVARLGGDEFAILFAPTSTTDTAAVAASVKRTLDPLTFVSAGKAISVTGSVGLAEETVGNTSLEERLLRIADESMYREKNVQPIGQPGRRALRDQSIHETG